MPTTSEFFTVHEVAQLLKLNPLTIYSYIHKGILPAASFGRTIRISKLDLENFISNSKHKGLNHEK